MHTAEIDDESAANIITRQEERIAAYLKSHKTDVQPEIAGFLEKIPMASLWEGNKKLK